MRTWLAEVALAALQNWSGEKEQPALGGSGIRATDECSLSPYLRLPAKSMHSNSLTHWQYGRRKQGFNEAL